MEFFEYWRAFNKCFDERNLSAQTQLVGYKLLAIDNEKMHPESFSLTDRELQSRTNIKSGQTIVEARRQLKNAGLIDFETAKNKPTRYRFTIKHEPSTGQAQGFVSYTRVREDVKTKEKKIDDDASARMSENVAAATSPADARAGRLSSCQNEADDIQELWEETFGYALRGNRALELLQLANKDLQRTKEGIRRTKKADGLKKGGLNDEFSYFKAVYDGLKPTTIEKVKDEKVEAKKEDDNFRRLEALRRMVVKEVST